MAAYSKWVTERLNGSQRDILVTLGHLLQFNSFNAYLLDWLAFAALMWLLLNLLDLPKMGIVVWLFHR